MNHEKITFYHNPMSRGRIVHWMLEEVGADYEAKILNWETNDHKKPEYLAVNPMGKIPAIVHRGVTVTETAAICLYLADAFPQASMAPALNDPARGTYYRWMLFAASCLEYSVIDRKNPRATPVPTGRIGYGTYEETMSAVEQAVKNGFILGERFSAADVYLSSSLGWSLYNKEIDPKPVFTEYVARCSDRPAYKRVNARG